MSRELVSDAELAIEDRSAASAKFADALRHAVLNTFVRNGYELTSLQHAADAAGVLRSDLVEHFSTKNMLLDAVLQPALTRLHSLVECVEAHRELDDGRETFLNGFADFLLDFPVEVRLFLEQGRVLHDVTGIDRATDDVERLTAALQTGATSVSDRLRVELALSGSAYAFNGLVSSGQLEGNKDHVRIAVLAAVRGLLPADTHATGVEAPTPLAPPTR